MGPFEAFKQLIFRVSPLSSRYYKRQGGIPGEVVKSLPDETRQVLSELKSDDIAEYDRNQKCWLGTDEYYEDQQYRKDKMDFDKKIKQ